MSIIHPPQVLFQALDGVEVGDCNLLVVHLFFSVPATLLNRKSKQLLPANSSRFKVLLKPLYLDLGEVLLILFHDLFPVHARPTPLTATTWTNHRFCKCRATPSIWVFLDLSDSAKSSRWYLTGNNNVLLWSFGTHFISIRLLNHLNLLSSLLFLSHASHESATGFLQPPSSEPAAISSLISFILNSYFCCISLAFRSNLNWCKTSRTLLYIYTYIYNIHDTLMLCMTQSVLLSSVLMSQLQNLLILPWPYFTFLARARKCLSGWACSNFSMRVKSCCALGMQLPRSVMQGQHQQEEKGFPTDQTKCKTVLLIRNLDLLQHLVIVQTASSPNTVPLQTNKWIRLEGMPPIWGP